jgi:hypothetical protein
MSKMGPVDAMHVDLPSGSQPEAHAEERAGSLGNQERVGMWARWGTVAPWTMGSLIWGSRLAAQHLLWEGCGNEGSQNYPAKHPGAIRFLQPSWKHSKVTWHQKPLNHPLTSWLGSGPPPGASEDSDSSWE